MDQVGRRASGSSCGEQILFPHVCGSGEKGAGLPNGIRSGWDPAGAVWSAPLIHTHDVLEGSQLLSTYIRFSRPHGLTTVGCICVKFERRGSVRIAFFRESYGAVRCGHFFSRILRCGAVRQKRNRTGPHRKEKPHRVKPWVISTVEDGR